MSLSFPLSVEDGWPPVGAECLPFRPSPEGYELLVPPLFVKDLSVGDVLDVVLDEGRVLRWRHVVRSACTTVWLLRMAQDPELEEVLVGLRKLGCNTVGLDDLGVHSIDVPAAVSMTAVDAILARLDPGRVATAFPSLRHAGPA